MTTETEFEFVIEPYDSMSHLRIDRTPKELQVGEHTVHYRVAESTLFFIFEGREGIYALPKVIKKNERSLDKKLSAAIEEGKFCRYICKNYGEHDDQFLIALYPNGDGAYADGPYGPIFDCPEEFSWASVLEEHQDIQLSADPLQADFLSMSEERLVELLQEIEPLMFEEMEDPFFDPSDEEPLNFTSGSEEELERITKVICFTESGLFDKPIRWGGTLTIRYSAAGDDGDGGYDSEGSYIPEGGLSDRLESLLELAFEHNSFAGYTWQYNDGAYGRRSGYDQSPESILVEIERPSAHDILAAYEQLKEWLKDKVPEAEMSYLLGLSTEAA